jgi:Sulfatase
MRKTLLVLAAIAGIAAPALAGTSPGPRPQTEPPRSSRPNLVFIMAGQLRYQSCGFAGDSRARTPQLDALAKQGVVFRNAVCGHPVCAAYRASLFTGKYTTSTGMVINELRLNTNHVFLAQVLTRHGFTGPRNASLPACGTGPEHPTSNARTCMNPGKAAIWHRQKAESRNGGERPRKAISSQVQARCKPCAWEEIGR